MTMARNGAGVVQERAKKIECPRRAMFLPKMLQREDEVALRRIVTFLPHSNLRTLPITIP
jgi:hypothetical protein